MLQLLNLSSVHTCSLSIRKYPTLVFQLGKLCCLAHLVLGTTKSTTYYKNIEPSCWTDHCNKKYRYDTNSTHLYTRFSFIRYDAINYTRQRHRIRWSSISFIFYSIRVYTNKTLTFWNSIARIMSIGYSKTHLIYYSAKKTFSEMARDGAWRLESICSKCGGRLVGINRR